jgi:SAM-dependent methyltransferase
LDVNASATPYDQNFYAGQSDGSYRSAKRIIPLAVRLVSPTGVLDVGCGVGTFLRAFIEEGVTDVQGVDGDYVPRDQLMIPTDRFRGHDLGLPLDFGRRYDLAMSLEVAEHLPDGRADLFVDNLCHHSDVVMFSAAIPGQGGTNHINEQWPSYWAAKFAARGYRVIDALRSAIWDDPTVEHWYRQNLLFFANDAGLARAPALAAAASSGPLNLAHPELFSRNSVTAQQAMQLLARHGDIQKMLEKLAGDGGTYRFQHSENGGVAIVRMS